MVHLDNLFHWFTLVVTKTRNHPKRPKTTHNHPQRPTTNPKRSTTTHNDPQRSTTTHKTCDFFAESQFFYYNRLKQVRLITRCLKSILLFVFNLCLICACKTVSLETNSPSYYQNTTTFSYDFKVKMSFGLSLTSLGLLHY